MPDPEIAAMSTIATALANLDDETRGRVLRWAGDRYGVTVGGAGPRRGEEGTAAADKGTHIVNSGGSAEAPQFEHFAELFAAARPMTNEDKVLVAAYWAQVKLGQDKWQSAGLQKELKNLGHAVTNITSALEGNIKKKPQLIIQLQKAGNTQQARKTFKVTHAGISYVESMLSRDD